MLKVVLYFSIVACWSRSSLAFPDPQNEGVLAKELQGVDNAVKKIAKRNIFQEGTKYPENKMLVEERFVGLTEIKKGDCDDCDYHYGLRDESGQRLKRKFYRPAIEELIRDKNPNQRLPSLLYMNYGNYPHLDGLEYLFKAIAIDNPKGVTDVFFKFGTPFMKVYGGDGKYRGEIGLDIEREKIVFFGSGKAFSSGSDKQMFNMKITNQEGEVVRDIIITGSDSMVDAMKKYDLGHGVRYEYGYTIEVSVSEPKRVSVKVNDDGRKDNPFKNFKSTSQKFILIDDELLSYEFYERKYLHLLLEWRKNFNLLKAEMDRQLKQDIPKYTDEQKTTWTKNKLLELSNRFHSLNQDIQIIQNSENIHKLKVKVARLEKKVDEQFEKLKIMINDLSRQIQTIGGESRDCQQGFGTISTISSLIPGADSIFSSVTGVIATACEIADV